MTVFGILWWVFAALLVFALLIFASYYALRWWVTRRVVGR